MAFYYAEICFNYCNYLTYNGREISCQTNLYRSYLVYILVELQVCYEVSARAGLTFVPISTILPQAGISMAGRYVWGSVVNIVYELLGP